MTLAIKDQLTKHIKIPIDEDDMRALDYYRDELEDTLKRFDAFKEKVNAIIEQGKQQEYLFEFRSMLSGHCIVKNRNLTIVQCVDIIRRDECKFHDQCKTRKKILDMIMINRYIT